LGRDGTLTINYNTEEHDIVSGEKIKWITSIDSQDGKNLSIHYNNGDSENITLDMDYGKGVTIDTSLTWRGVGTESYTTGMITESLKSVNNFFKKRIIIENQSLNRFPRFQVRSSQEEDVWQYFGASPGYITQEGIFKPSTVYWTTDFIPIFNDSKELENIDSNTYVFTPYVFCYFNEQGVLTEKIVNNITTYDINYKFIGPGGSSPGSHYITNQGGKIKYIRLTFTMQNNYESAWELQDNFNLMLLMNGKVYNSTQDLPNLTTNINYFIENTNIEKSVFGTNYKIAVFGDGIVGGAYNDNKSYVTMACE